MQKEVTLSSGLTVTVYSVPLYALSAVESTIPLPDAPMRVVKTIAGEEATPDTMDDSPAYQEYIQVRRKALDARKVKADELTLLMGLKDVTPSDDTEWFAPLAYSGIAAREGMLGRKLDYIQYVLLAHESDLRAVYNAISDISFVREDAIAAAMSSFQGNGQRNGAERSAESVSSTAE